MSDDFSDILAQLGVGIASGFIVLLVLKFLQYARRTPKRIRAHLLKRRASKRRAAYVRTYVGAIKGRTSRRAAHHANLNILLLGAVVASCALISQRTYTSLRIQRSLATVAHLELIQSIAEEGKDRQGNKPNVDQSLNEQRLAAATYLREQAARGGPPAEAFVQSTTAAILLMLALLAAIRVIASDPWDNQFSTAFDRFSLRIQGLAKREELVRLVELEAKVSDEDSLRAYVLEMSKIAERHGIGFIIEPFAIWAEPETALA